MSETYFAPLRPGDDGFFRTGGDDRMFVQFSLKSRRNAFKSDQAGRPIHEPVDYITIQQPGERDKLVRPVVESDKHRWPRLWDAYQRKAAQTSTGTPVQMLFPNEPHIVEVLQDLKFDTIEQLAEASEHAIDRLGMDGRKYVGRAQAALNQAVQASEVTRLERRLEDALDRVQTLTDANNGMAERLRVLEEALRPQAHHQAPPPPMPPLRSRQPPPELEGVMVEVPEPERVEVVG